MKRSEMIALIMSEGKILFRYEAEHLLSCMEEKGMLPPDIAVDPYDMYCKWEDEND